MDGIHRAIAGSLQSLRQWDVEEEVTMLSKPIIVVGTDFSECSDHALRAGEKLRRLTNGTLHIVHVATFPTEPEWFTTDASAVLLPITYRQDVLKELHRAIEHQSRRCEVTAQRHVVPGYNQKTLSKFVKDHKADLLIMGHKGSGAMHGLMGSFTTKMLTTNEVPLLIVNGPLEVKKVAGLVETEHPVKKIFSATEELGFLFSAEIEFISVWQDIGALYSGPFPVTPMKSARFTEDEVGKVNAIMAEKIREYMDPHSKAFVRTEVVTDKSISASLMRIMDDEKVDIGVLSRNRQNLVEKIFIGSVARRLLEHYPGNFLVLPPEN